MEIGGTSPRRTWRRATIGVVIGSMLGLTSLAGCSLVEGSDATPGSTTSTTYVIDDIDYSPGDCAYWDQEADDGTRDARVVPCTENHIVQILGSTEVRMRAGAYPGDDGLDALTASACAAQERSFLGAPLLENGQFSAYTLSITPEGWAQGERTYWCGIAELDKYSPGSLTAKVVHTDARGQGDHQVVETPVGTCSRGFLQLRRNPDLAPYVTCDKPHAWEATGHVSFGADEPYPDGDHFHQVTTDGCQALFDAKVRPGVTGLVSSNMGITQLDWIAGDRTVTCIATRTGSRPITGSVLK